MSVWPLSFSKVSEGREREKDGVIDFPFSDTARGSERQDFLSEIEMMKKVSEGHSHHVVGMLGCSTLREPLCLLTEFVKHGDLLSYLRSSRKIVSSNKL